MLGSELLILDDLLDLNSSLTYFYPFLSKHLEIVNISNQKQDASSDHGFVEQKNVNQNQIIIIFLFQYYYIDFLNP